MNWLLALLTAISIIFCFIYIIQILSTIMDILESYDNPIKTKCQFWWRLTPVLFPTLYIIKSITKVYRNYKSLKGC